VYKVFDLIFVDGNHLYDGALADLRQMSRLARPDNKTVVVVDDCSDELKVLLLLRY
jgi:hypothetical protein